MEDSSHSMFKERRALVEACTDPAGPALYRRLYGLAPQETARVLESEEQWRSLPFLTKDILSDTPIPEREFCPHAQVDMVATSSGTSGKPPLFTPRAYLSGYEYREEFCANNDPFLVGIGPPHRHEYWARSEERGRNMISFDPKRIEASVRIAAIAGVRSIYVFPYVVSQVGERMLAEGVADAISYLEITGESCSESLFAYMRRVFPNATIVATLGASELEYSPHGIPCRAAKSAHDVGIYHANRNCFLELIDPDTGSVLGRTVGAEGELVITTLGGSLASPFIRYRTGDMVRIEEEHCEKHGSWTFSVTGRVNDDFIKIRGGQLRVDEIERVLRELRLSDQFELHIYEKESAHGPRILAILHVRASTPFDRASAASAIAEKLRVGPSYTYADGVRDSIYFPLECVELDVSHPTAKRRRMVSHR